jgi:hypothetical protein
MYSVPVPTISREKVEVDELESEPAPVEEAPGGKYGSPSPGSRVKSPLEPALVDTDGFEPVVEESTLEDESLAEELDSVSEESAGESEEPAVGIAAGSVESSSLLSGSLVVVEAGTV